MSDTAIDMLANFGNLMSGTTLDCRAGIVLLPLRQLGDARNLAVDLRADFVDYHQWRLDHMQAGTNFLNLTENVLADDLSAISQNYRGKRCAVVANLDLAFACLPFEKRNTVWRYLRKQMRRRPVGLIITLPEIADKILPSGSERAIWLESQRLITLP